MSVWCISFIISVQRDLSTSPRYHKKTPHTVGVMSWVRAAYRRKYLEQNMKDKVKSDELIKKEEILKRTDPALEFRTTSRYKEHFMYNEQAMEGLQVK